MIENCFNNDQQPNESSLMNTPSDAVFFLEGNTNNSAEILKKSATGNFKNNPLIANDAAEEKAGEGLAMAQSFYCG